MSLALTHRTSAGEASSTRTSKTSASFTPSANSKLYVFAWAQSGNTTDPSLTLSDSAGLTWTAVEDAAAAVGAFAPHVSLWEATVGASPVAMTVTVSSTPAAYIALSVFDVTGNNPTIVAGQVASNVVDGTGEPIATGTLPAAVTPGNLTIVAAGANRDSAQAVPAPSGFTVLDAISGGGNFEETTISYSTAFTGTSTSYSNAPDHENAGSVIFEIEEAALPTSEGTASGSYAYAGSTSGSTEHAGTASGSYADTGSAAGSAEHNGSGSGSYAFAGSATGSAPAVGAAQGTAAGSFAFDGSATGTEQPAGTTSGAYTYTGSATGSAPIVGAAEGSASGSYAFTGSATGSAPAVGVNSGTAAGTFAYSGSASGARASEGACSGLWDFTGTATGTTPAVGVNSGSASGSWNFSGTAAGEKAPSGSASGTVAFVGAPAGTTERSGSATGAYALAGTAHGANFQRDLDVEIGQAYLAWDCGFDLVWIAEKHLPWASGPATFD